MNIRYTVAALRQLDKIYAYIANDRPDAALSVVFHIQASIERLGRYPRMGRTTD